METHSSDAQNEQQSDKTETKDTWMKPELKHYSRVKHIVQSGDNIRTPEGANYKPS